MTSDTKKPATIDEYIARFAPDVQSILNRIRATINAAAPDAKEVISYQMPAFRGRTILVYFAAWKEHIGLYPPVSGNEKLVKDCARYAGPKGNLQFPIDEPIPYALITRIVKHRVAQDAMKRRTKPAQEKRST
jgi:uncharacterized protein YdhG (YjbR/CyaY superfamily)